MCICIKLYLQYYGNFMFYVMVIHFIYIRYSFSFFYLCFRYLFLFFSILYIHFHNFSSFLLISCILHTPSILFIKWKPEYKNKLNFVSVFHAGIHPKYKIHNVATLKNGRIQGIKISSLFFSFWYYAFYFFFMFWNSSFFFNTIFYVVFFYAK